MNKNGKITAKKAGTAVIKATANGKTAKCTVTVEASNATIELNRSWWAVKKGGTYTLVARVTGTTNTVKWSSSDASIATVNSKGVVTGVSEGICTITAKVDGKKATCTIRVASGLISTMNELFGVVNF